MAHFLSKRFYEVPIMIRPPLLRFSSLYDAMSCFFLRGKALVQLTTTARGRWSILMYVPSAACSLESQIREATLFMLNVKLYSVTRINWFPVCCHNKRSYLKTNVEYQCKLFINSLLSKFATVKSYHSGTFGLRIASKSLGLILEDKTKEQKTGNYWA